MYNIVLGRDLVRALALELYDTICADIKAEDEKIETQQKSVKEDKEKEGSNENEQTGNSLPFQGCS